MISSFLSIAGFPTDNYFREFGKIVTEEPATLVCQDVPDSYFTEVYVDSSDSGGEEEPRISQRAAMDPTEPEPEPDNDYLDGMDNGLQLEDSGALQLNEEDSSDKADLPAGANDGQEERVNDEEDGSGSEADGSGLGNGIGNGWSSGSDDEEAKQQQRRRIGMDDGSDSGSTGSSSEDDSEEDDENGNGIEALVKHQAKGTAKK